jgi:hypothetical protein
LLRWTAELNFPLSADRRVYVSQSASVTVALSQAGSKHRKGMLCCRATTSSFIYLTTLYCCPAAAAAKGCFQKRAH